MCKRFSNKLQRRGSRRFKKRDTWFGKGTPVFNANDGKALISHDQRYDPVTNKMQKFKIKNAGDNCVTVCTIDFRDYDIVVAGYAGIFYGQSHDAEAELDYFVGLPKGNTPRGLYFASFKNHLYAYHWASNTVYSLDSGEAQWKSLPNPLASHHFPSLMATATHLYVFAGKADDIDITSKPEVFSFQDNAWTELSLEFASGCQHAGDLSLPWQRYKYAMDAKHLVAFYMRGSYVMRATLSIKGIRVSMHSKINSPNISQNTGDLKLAILSLSGRFKK